MAFQIIRTAEDLEIHMTEVLKSAQNPTKWLFEGLAFEDYYRVTAPGAGAAKVTPLQLIKKIFEKLVQGVPLVEVVFDRCSFGHLTLENVQADSVDIRRSGIKSLFVCNLNVLTVSVSNCDIAHTKIAGKLTSTALDIKNSALKIVVAEDVQFLCPISFYGCMMGQSEARYSGVSFNRSNFSAKADFGNVTFLEPPLFFNAVLHEDTSFSLSRFPALGVQYAWRAYRALKHHMMQFESDHEAQIFHALELESRYNTELPKGWKIFSDPKGVETIASYFMRQLNNYGQHLWLPPIWLLYISCWFLVLYAASGGVGYFPAEGKEVAGWVENAGQYYSNVTFAARNFFGPFGLILSADEIQPNNMAVKSLGVIHFLLSSLIWFIWILQRRRRFKL
ncbi:MAG: hypothetical protein Q8K65_01515 [Alphaproteobacteria bacterium]|nr:hypothetical protein [Alphaproteobacteria bacterium]